ncbi:MAG: PAS domain S-box protein [Rhodospirillales bacterium]|nr:PAS domain S-box protein [Rhodospirillales bacterium]
MMAKNNPDSALPADFIDNKELFKHIFEYAPIGMTIIGLKGEFLVVNQSFCEFIGYSSKELYSKTVFDVTHPDDRKKSINHRKNITRQAIESNQEEKRYIRKNGEVVWGLLNRSVVKDAKGRTQYTIGQVQDITELKETQETIIQSDKRYARALAGTMDGIWELNLLTGDDFKSPRWSSMLGYGEDELGNTREDFLNLVHPDDLAIVDDRLRAHLEEGVPYDYTIRMRHKQGHYLYIHARGQAYRDESNTPIYMSGAHTDITEKIEAERDLIKAMRLKNEFVSTVSHELRTPLTSIIGSLAILNSGKAGELSDKFKSVLDIAQRNSQRLSLLVNDLLDIEKLEFGQLQLNERRIDVVELIEESIEVNKGYSDEYGVYFRLLETPPNIVIKGDKDRLLQVMSNLMSNASKFSPSGGVIEISGSASDGLASISITDHGSGIPKEFHDQVFDKFTQADSTATRHKGGTGLGLSITKSIVEQHGGNISFKTQKGKGTTFTFTLPLINETGAADGQ